MPHSQAQVHDRIEFPLRYPYSTAAIRRCVRASDSRDFGIDLKADRENLVRDTLEQAQIDPSPLSRFREVHKKGKKCFHFSEYTTNLITRATCNYLSQRFRITPPNRDRVVKSVIEAMSDASPFHVIRRDIKSFYENIPIEEMRDRLLFDTAISKQVRSHLRAYFSILPGSTGLPRGIGLTTILAELAMHQFDQAVRALPGVYRYFRYSDDILILCTDDLGATESKISELLPAPMKFNLSKSHSRSFFPIKNNDEMRNFDYLGYNFAANTASPRKGDPRICSVTISDSKIRRIKTRLYLSFKSIRPNEHGLFLNRVRYLSGNYRVDRLPGYFELRGNFTRSGIFYNYKRCGNHSGPHHRPMSLQQLIELDWFYHNLLSSPKSEFSGVLQSIQPAILAKLRRISFHKGHSLKLSAKIPPASIGRIKSIWRNV